MKDLDRFNAIAWVVRHGRILPWATSALFLAGGVLLSYQQAKPVWAIAGVVGGGLLWGVVRLAVEVIDLVAETLLPR